MTQVSTPQAAEILSLSRQTIYRHVESGLLPARRVGVGQDVRIDLDDLRRFAEKYNYAFDEEAAQRLSR